MNKHVLIKSCFIKGKSCNTKNSLLTWLDLLVKWNSSIPFRKHKCRDALEVHTDKKKIKFSSYIRKFWMEQLQSHIWLTASSYTVWGNICAFPHISESPSSYMTLQLLHSEFSYIWGKLYFLFYQCKCKSAKWSCNCTMAKIIEMWVYAEPLTVPPLSR